MTITSIMCAALISVSVCAPDQESKSPIIACNPGAIHAAERPRLSDLMKRMRRAVRNRNELADGYAFQLDGKTIPLAEAAEWIAMERLCCPLLTFQLTASGNRADWQLTLTGPKGVKPLLQAEFPER